MRRGDGHENGPYGAINTRAGGREAQKGAARNKKVHSSQTPRVLSILQKVQASQTPRVLSYPRDFSVFFVFYSWYAAEHAARLLSVTLGGKKSTLNSIAVARTSRSRIFALVGKVMVCLGGWRSPAASATAGVPE